jgi:hypothetical protein
MKSIFAFGMLLFSLQCNAAIKTIDSTFDVFARRQDSLMMDAYY